MKKRNLIALLMAVCMMFSLLPVNAIAVGDEGTIPAEETLLSENGNDSAPAGSTNPAGDKDSIPGTGKKPSAAEEPVKDEESAKDEEPGKDEEPAEDEEGGKTNVVPMRVVRPDTDKYLTYVFRVDGAEVSRQIVKKGDTLYQPVSPVKDGYKFTGWFVGASELAFGTVGEISESARINVDAGFTEVLYVFFADTNGRIVHTKEGVKGDVIKTDDVTYGLENTTHAITGWYLEGSYQTPADSVTLDKENITVYAKVEPGHWLHFDSDGGTYIAPQFYSADATTAAPNVVTKPGYTFSHWEYNGTKFEFGSPLTENITLKAHWNVNTSTRYTVIHWQENANDEEFSFKEAETKTGSTGSRTSAAAKSYTGFTAQTIAQQTIAGDGSTVVNVYYKRNVYTIRFYNNRGSEYTNLAITAKYARPSATSGPPTTAAAPGPRRPAAAPIRSTSTPCRSTAPSSTARRPAAAPKRRTIMSKSCPARAGRPLSAASPTSCIIPILPPATATASRWRTSTPSPALHSTPVSARRPAADTITPNSTTPATPTILYT